MDASALLKSQGWRGKGFSLHPTDNSIGLQKPILLSRNTDGRGIGQKPHVTSDQWWLHAFDQKLKGLDTSQKGAVTQTITKGKLDVVVPTGKNGKYTGTSGLYASFVSGGLLEGTLFPTESTTTTEAETSSTDATPISSSSEDDSSSSRKKKSKKINREGETKEEGRMRRQARRLRKAQKEDVTKKTAEDAGEKQGKKKKKIKSAEKVAKKESKQLLRKTETKEDRRARRIERRARKEARRNKRAAAGQSTG